MDMFDIQLLSQADLALVSGSNSGKSRITLF
jgi:hypothetical protein